MSGPSNAGQNFKNPVINWIDYRLPIFTMMDKEYGRFPSPRNFNYFWNFGAIALVMLLTMIATGIVLAMNYTPHALMAFDSVERITRDVNHGWMLRYIHANGASFFFIAVYIHIFRGLYYGSYKQPRELLWILGVVIFLLMMATAFMGYVLPWGQMSFWGATVITNFFTAIPLVGDSITTWLWGGFAVENPTLNRFFALHYLLPFIIFAVVFLHLAALHIHGSNNPLGIDVKGPQDTVSFHPFYTVKDLFGTLVFLAIFAVFVFWFPNSLGHPDNYIPANPLSTPAHIVPEWYFLPFYAILRAVTFDLGIPLPNNTLFMVVVVLAAIVAAVVAAFVAFRFAPVKQAWQRIAAAVVGAGVGLMGTFYAPYIAAQLLDVVTAKADTPVAELLATNFHMAALFIPAKLGGVIAMFGAIAILFVLPWLDTHPVRSARFRPQYRLGLIVLMVAIVALTMVGANLPDAKVNLFGLHLPFTYLTLGQLSTLYYFGFFLVLLPVLSRTEKALPLPTSIADAVTKKGACCASLVLALLVLAAPARAAEGEVALDRQVWPHHGVVGTYDRGALQRGFQVYKEVCSACHSMHQLSYRNLTALGFSADEVKAIAAGYMVNAEPDENGDIKERPALPSDRFKNPFANSNAARAANNGALPPDLSLIVKAREGHEDYVYSLLTGYHAAPEGFTLMPGMNYNIAFPGHQIAMAQPLNDGAVTFADGTPSTVAQMAKDVTQFLAWAGEPHMEERKQTGVKVLIFLVFFAGIMYAAKRRVWKDLH